MKKISLKVKLTMMYTFFMVLLTCTSLAIMFSLSSREVLSSVRMDLENRVQESVDDIYLRDGKIQVDADFYSVTDNVYLSLYGEDMYFLYGKVPYGFDQKLAITDGKFQAVNEGEKEWYVYDASFKITLDDTVYVRGITSVTEAEESFLVTIRIALLALPLLVIATAIIGYRFTRRTLLPVKEITRTVRKIRSDADLSRRVGLMGTKNDSPEQKGGDEIYTLAVTFDEMLKELETVFQREKQFSSDVSHELRTPISVILAQCDALLKEKGLSPKQEEEIRLIERKARGMSEMISHLLFLSRADQGRQPLSLEYLNISELTEMIVEEQRMLSEAEGKGVQIRTEIQPDVWAKADETFYIRMLINLLSNARRYSREKGEVLVALAASDTQLTLTVQDHGTGIAKEALPHIWERFYRADPARAGENHAGLGLSMVKWMAEAHGGSAAAESREGEGSKFVIRLPYHSGY